jgi:replicative DNA helicase
VPLEIALRRFADQISQRADDHREGISTGFASLDAKTGGLQPSDLILPPAGPDSERRASR